MDTQETRKLYWHKLAAEHTCGKQMTCHAVSFNSKGEYLIDWICVKCGKEESRVYNSAACICAAFESDLEATFFQEAA